MEAGNLLQTYQIRKAGYESGLLKYSSSLYGAVCALVDNLGQMASDEEIRIEHNLERGFFIVVRTGAIIGEVPLGEAGQDGGEGAG